MIPQLAETSWLPWTIGISVAFPVLVILLGEVAHRMRDRSKNMAEIILLVRALVLPSIAILIFLVKVINLPWNSWGVRIAQTGLWIFVIHVGLLSLNATFFRDEGVSRNKTVVPKLFRDLVRFVLVGIGAAIVLSAVWGTDLGGLMAALGVGSIVIGLALQDTLGNLMAGIAMLFERPFNNGDLIRIGDHEGWVSETNWRAVRMRTRTGDLLVLPNSIIATETIRNLSQPLSRHAEVVTLGFSYNDPPNIVKAALQQTAIETPGVLAEPSPDIRTVNYNDSSIDYDVVIWMASPNELVTVRNEFMTRIWYMAQRHGFNIPFPIRTVELTRPAPAPPIEEEVGEARGLRGLEDEELQKVVSQSTIQSFGTGETILKQGTSSPGLFWILEGAIALIAEENGETIPLAVLSAGDGLGQETLLRGQATIATATASTDVKILLMPPEASREFLSFQPQIARQLDRATEKRLETISDSVQDSRAQQRASLFKRMTLQQGGLQNDH